MLGNTLIVIALAIITTIFLHLVITRVLHIHTSHTAFEQFTNFISSVQRPIIMPHDTQLSHCRLQDAFRSPSEYNHAIQTSFSPDSLQHTTQNATQNATQNVTKSDASYPNTQAHTNNVQSLEDELKQWMQRESTNWAEGSNSSSYPGKITTQSTSSTPSTSYDQNAPSMSTSLDQVFQEQEVNMKNVQLPSLQNDVTLPSPKHSSVSYTNTMNSGDLGDGLSAFDGTDCAFASFS